MSRPSSSDISNMHQNIPQGIRQAMDQQMSTLPAHLQHEISAGGPMSTQTQKSITDHMQKNMPTHLKQYAGAYMEQNVINPSIGTHAMASSTPQPHAPMPDRMRLDHSSGVDAEQYDADFHNDLFASDQQVPPPPAPPAPPPAPQPQHTPDYGFIMEPSKPPRAPSLPTLPGNGSPIVRIAVVVGGLIVLLILFVIIKGLFSGGGNTQALTSVAQEQQQIIHVASGQALSSQSQQQTVLSDATQNFAITTQATMTSAQQQLLAYMQANHKKVNPKQLTTMLDASTDQQLSAAATNTTYDSTFRQVLQSELTNYQKALQVAYKQTPGPKGRKLLTQQYQDAQLLLQQLTSLAS